MRIDSKEIDLRLVARNLLTNAIRHTPAAARSGWA